MLGDAEAVHDSGALRAAVELRRRDEVACVDVADLRHALGRVGLHHLGELGESLGALADEPLVDEPFADEHVNHAVGECHVGAGADLQVDVGVRRQADVAGIHHNEVGSLLDGTPDLHAEDGMRLLGVRSDEQHHVGVGRDVLDGVRHGSGTECRCSNEVSLWNRTEKHIAEILKSNKIVCSGVVSGEAHIKKASCKIDEVISDVIMVTTPSSAHKDIARVLAPFVTKDTVIVLNPGRTFGAIEFAETLKNCGVVELPHIAETQTIVYTCRRSDKNSVTIFALKEGVKIASIAKDDLNYILAAIPECIRWYFIKSNSVVETSMTNVGMVLHCAPVLMNIGWIESEKTEFKYYYDGISKSVATFLEKIDSERIAVAKALGEDIESVKHWLERTYSTSGNNLFETIQNNASYREIDAPPTINCRYIFEDVPNGLVPVEKMGRELGVTTPNISLVIDLANAVMETDFRKTGRSYCYELVKKYL